MSLSERRNRPGRGLLSKFVSASFLWALLSTGCNTHSDNVCESIADCERGGDSEWIAACQEEAKKLSDEASTLGCDKAVDNYYDCADKSVHCRGATASIPDCATEKTALEECLTNAQGKTSCVELLERKSACGNDMSSDDASPPQACTLARNCAARCYLDQVGDACTPDAAELEGVNTCAESCPP